MSSIAKIRSIALFFIVGLLLSAGCGSTKNDNSVFDEDAHPADWKVTHKIAALQNPATCEECHGADLSGGIAKVACTYCHVNGSPLELKNCTSCHGNPPAVYIAPDRAGAHTTVGGHFAAGVVLPEGCNTCHSGAGSGTLLHDNGVVDVRLLKAYNAKSGTAVYNANGTCSKVSCHGGQTTPDWLTGTIDLQTQCTSCHSYGTAEYNSFFSGQHAYHVGIGKPCTGCHDPALLTVNHFTSLNTSSLEGPASATIRTDTIQYDSVAHTCTAACHSNPNQVRGW